MEKIHLLEVDSTNDYIKREYLYLKEHCCVYADEQTKGKGRRGHVWVSHKNANLTVSFLFKDIIGLQNAWTYTMMAAKCIIDVLKEYHIEAKVKWPNDIYVGNQKICGILTETILDPDLKGVIVGIGLNVNEASPYICMKNITGIHYNVEDVLDILIECFENALKIPFSVHLMYLNQHSYLKGKRVKYKEYGYVEFVELKDNGMIAFVDEQMQVHVHMLNEITLSND